MDQILDDDIRELTEEDYGEIARIRDEGQKYLKQITNGRIAVFVLIGLTILGVLLAPSRGIPIGDALIEGLIMIGLYIGGLIYANNNPSIGFIAILVVYSLLIVLGMLINPESLLRGILVKGIIIYYMAQAISGGKKIEALNQKLKRYGVGPVR